MKKLALFMALLMFSTLVLNSCNKTGADESNQSSVSAFESSEQSKTSTESEAPFVPKYETPVSIGKKYTSPVTNPPYEDSYHSELTDGLYAGNDKGYSDPKWSNYGRPDPVVIVIDLEEDSTDLYKFEVSYYHDLGPGIGTPMSISVSASDDASKWDFVCNISSKLDSEPGAYKVSNTLKKPINARYIRFSMSRYAANLFLDELTVYADVEGSNFSESLKTEIANKYKDDNFNYSDSIKNLKTKQIYFSKELVNVSKGQYYKLSKAAIEKFPDSSKLTDGQKIGTIYESGNWVGFEGDDPLEITLDLKQKHNDLSVFSVSAHSNAGVGVIFPIFIDFFVSDDGNQYTKIGRVYAATSPKLYFYNYTLSLPQAIEARYVKYSIHSQSKSTLMIEEIGAFAYREVKQEPFIGMYAEKPIAHIKTEKLFSPSEADYSKTINLIRGKTQQIYAYFPLAKNDNVYGNTPESSTLMTDGKFATAENYTDSAFFKFGGSHGRDIVYDLGATATVTGFSVSFLRQDEVGINVLSSVMFYLSEDGVNWYGVLSGAMPSNKPTEILRYKFDLDKAYKARYARFSFKVWPNAYCDELEVFGTKKVDKNSVSLNKSGKRVSKFTVDAYTPRDAGFLGGAKDIVLVPNYSAADEKAKVEGRGYSKDELLPYVAYLDKDKKIKDTMFDGFLFCPTGALMDGNYFYMNANMREVKDMTDKMFENNRDLAALEAAVGETKAALNGLTDYKAKFYFTLCYPGEGTTFGDLNGDGVVDKLTTTKDRINAVKWAIDDFFSRYNAKSYKNIEFAGFYWVHESMAANQNDGELINAISDYCRSKGYGLFWIPYFCSNGFDQWQYYGFDVACMQPNYAFDAGSNDKLVEYTATMAKRFGMCLEMEITGAALTDPVFFNKYLEYLTGGVKYGYMKDTIHMYYQDILLYYNSYMSDDAKARLIYEYTYQFIKGTLSLNAAKADDLAFTVKADTELNESLNKKNMVGEFYLAVSPKHGTVTIAPDGTFSYYPQKSFKGDDVFEYYYYDYLGNSRNAKVIVTVGQ